MTKLNDPFNPDGGAFARNIRSEKAADDTELRASLEQFGWVKEFPAIADENGVVLVGHRRMRIAKQLSISPVIQTLTLGKGDEADAERLKIALASNIGSAPMKKEDRQRIAKHLYGTREWTMERIGEALSVGFSTVQRDLGNLPTAGKLNPAKTASNPKGAGRPKGSKKTRAETAPQAVAREERVAVLMDAGKTTREIAAEFGVVERAAAQWVEHVKIRRDAEAQIDPATLSLSAQEKLAAAIRQATHKLNVAFERRVSDDLRRRLDEIVLPHWKQQIDQAQELYKHRRGAMDKATFNKIRRALHPDSRNSISDKVLADAFDTFMRLEKFLLDEKDSPTDFGAVPSSLAEWDAMKQKTSAERRAKRNNQVKIARRH